MHPFTAVLVWPACQPHVTQSVSLCCVALKKVCLQRSM